MVITQKNTDGFYKIYITETSKKTGEKRQLEISIAEDDYNSLASVCEALQEKILLTKENQILVNAETGLIIKLNYKECKLCELDEYMNFVLSFVHECSEITKKPLKDHPITYMNESHWKELMGQTGISS